MPVDVLLPLSRLLSESGKAWQAGHGARLGMSEMSEIHLEKDRHLMRPDHGKKLKSGKVSAQVEQ
jgi:hypothetical protein